MSGENERKHPETDEALPEQESGTVPKPSSVSIGTQEVDAGGLGVLIGSRRGAHERGSIRVSAENINVRGGCGVAFHEHNVYVGPESAEERARRTKFIHIVRRQWIQGVLEHPVQGPDTTLIRLNLEPRPDDVENPFRRPARSGAAPRSSPPSDAAIAAQFEQHGPTMLLLGQPGSGKTTTLLQLAEALLAAAEHDESKPIPVVFSLSSWKASDRSIEEWAIRELRQMYSTPVDLAKRWLARGRVLLLLDGLDEVAHSQRASCVEALNTYSAGAGLSGLVVSCRIEEYAQLPKRLQVYSALELLPLSGAQAESLLRGAGTLRVDLDRLLGSAGAELSASPLMLSAVSRIVRANGQRLTPSSAESPEALQRDVMQIYVDTMLQVRGHSWPAELRARFRHVTGQLAKCMRDNSEAVFAQERLQPSWLGDERDIKRYLWASRGLALGLGWVIITSLGYFSPVDERIATKSLRVIGSLTSLAIIVGVILTIIACTTVAWRGSGPNRLLAAIRLILWTLIVYPGTLPAAQRLSGSPRNDVRLTEVRVWIWKAWRERLWRWSWACAFGGSLFVAVMFAYIGGKTEAELRPLLPQMRAVTSEGPGTLLLLVVATLSGCAIIAALTYSLLHFLRRFESRLLTSSVCISLVGALTLFAARGEMDLLESAMAVLCCGSAFLLMSAVMCAPIAGLATRQLTESGRSGARLREAWLTTLSILAVSVCVIVVALWFTPAQDMAPEAANLGRQVGLSVVSTATSVGPPLAFYCGGFDLCCYYILSGMLHRRGILAGDVQRFLDAGVDAMILQRVGGSYRFVHEHIQRAFIEAQNES